MKTITHCTKSLLEPITGTLTFYQFAQPSLESGNYTVSVQQTVSSTDNKVPVSTYQNTHQFCVTGARFSLNPTDISSCFPPENSQGEFSNVIPHVCLSSPTLPWERSTGDGSNLSATEANVDSWLGLLLFTEDDPALHVQQVTLQDLVGKLPPNTFYPKFQLEYSESWTDPCLVIDVPAQLFNKIAPTAKDLSWLAHVKDIQPKTTQSEKYISHLKSLSTLTSSPKLSSVISNRLPASGKENTVFLVSFENWAPYLPQNDGSQSGIPKEITTVRLVVLKKWRFFAVSEKETFSEYLLNLNKPNGDGLLQLQPLANPSSEAEKAINNAFNMGYVPLNHKTRQGDRTVSWYKGPFLPFDTTGTIDIPVISADSITNYNPDTGMFDISYAAAWQIGRLLALQNKKFAQALYNWKRANTLSSILTFEKEVVSGTLKEIAGISSSENDQNLKALTNRVLYQIISAFIQKTGSSTGDRK